MPRVEDPPGDLELIKAVTDHCERFLGPCVRILQEKSSNFVHIDLLEFCPDPDDPFHVFVTCGMSSRPMNVPADVVNAEQYRYAELVLCLPDGWPLAWEELQTKETWWPLDALRSLARIPSSRESWVWGGHTLSNEGPYSQDTKLSAALVSPEGLFEPEFTVLPHKGHDIVFLQLAFIYPEELAYSTANYSDAFLERVRNSGLMPFDFFVLDKNRANTCL